MKFILKFQHFQHRIVFYRNRSCIVQMHNVDNARLMSTDANKTIIFL